MELAPEGEYSLSASRSSDTDKSHSAVVLGTYDEERGGRAPDDESSELLSATERQSAGMAGAFYEAEGGSVKPGTVRTRSDGKKVARVKKARLATACAPAEGQTPDGVSDQDRESQRKGEMRTREDIEKEFTR